MTRLAIVVCFLSSSVLMANKIDTLYGTELQVTGRHAFGPQGLELISSAAYFGFSFKGKQCQVFTQLASVGEHSYLQYELDGVYQKRVRIDGSSKEPLLLTASQEGIHTVWFYKATEAHTGPIFIHKITGMKIKALKRPTGPLIEFIGNSITCGAAADASEVPCGKGDYHDQHNAYMAYGPRVARTLKSQFLLSSVSGIGVYRNWNSEGPVMPQVYEKTDFQNESARLWDFTTFKPQIVSIALGTNDYSNGDGIKQRLPFDSAQFVASYIKLVQLVKSKYPLAQIVLLSSPMVQGERMIQFQNCLSVVKKALDEQYPESKAIALHFFKPFQGSGCSTHPSVEDHEVMANELVPFFLKLLQNTK